jgi:RNA recognition motif-containing protein
LINIFVGSLAYAATESELRELFESHGEVTSCKIITDRDTGRSKGFGFVEMADKAEGESAIEALNGQDLSGRTIVVNEARPREERPKRNFGDRGNRSGGRGGRY